MGTNSLSKIKNNPDEWNISRQGDFIRLKDNLKFVERKLEQIREHLKKPFQGKIRFTKKTIEQISKERYDKVWEEVNFDYEKLHEWLYEEKNKDKVEIVKLEGSDFSEATEAIFNYVKSSKQKWRIRSADFKEGWGLRGTLVNEETGQVIYSSSFIKEKIHELAEAELNGGAGVLLSLEEQKRTWKNNTSTMIFLHGTYGAKNQFPELEKKFPNTKFIYPNSPTLQYDMWHGSNKAPGGQCQGWINITGDAHELMDTDVCPNNSPPKKNFEEADKIIHLDYHQLMRAVSYVNEIIEREIAAGIPSEKIFISSYSQGGLLTLAVALTSQTKLGGFIPLCGLLPRWDKLLVKPSEKNKETPCLIINNSVDFWVPFWTGKKSYDLLKERGYNVEFKTRPGRGHGWENEDVEKFLVKCLFREYFRSKNILSIEIDEKGLLIKYQNGQKAIISANEFTPEQGEIKNFLEANNKKSLTWEELGTSQVHNPDVLERKNGTNYLWWIILGLIITGLVLVVIIQLFKKAGKSKN